MAHSFTSLTAMLTSLGSCFMNEVRLSAMASCLQTVQAPTASFRHARALPFTLTEDDAVHGP